MGFDDFAITSDVNERKPVVSCSFCGRKHREDLMFLVIVPPEDVSSSVNTSCPIRICWQCGVVGIVTYFQSLVAQGTINRVEEETDGLV